jgi:hypothetical protein
MDIAPKMEKTKTEEVKSQEVKNTQEIVTEKTIEDVKSKIESNYNKSKSKLEIE